MLRTEQGRGRTLMYDGRSMLLVFFLCDPELVECAQTSQYGTPKPRSVFPLEGYCRGMDLDLLLDTSASVWEQTHTWHQSCELHI